MSEYFLNEFTFQLPEGLKDKTHHIFALSDDGRVLSTTGSAQECESLS